jgi:hypothetical protein
VRLQALLSSLADLDGAPEPTAAEEDLDLATDEEMFELIDNELGRTEPTDASPAAGPGREERFGG